MNNFKPRLIVNFYLLPVVAAGILCCLNSTRIVFAETSSSTNTSLSDQSESSEETTADSSEETEATADSNPAEEVSSEVAFPTAEPSVWTDSDFKRFEIIPEVYRYKYTERIGVRDRGWKYGLRGTYPLRLAEHSAIESWKDILSQDALINVFKAEVRGSYGKVDYDGTGTVKDIPDYNVEGQLTAGYDVPIGEHVRVTPYTGVGYRYLFNQFSVADANSTTYSGYDRESKYFYIPLGAETQVKMDQGWALLFAGEFDFLVTGTQISHLENMHDDTGANAGYSELKNDQNKGLGWRMSVRLQKETPSFDLFTESFIRYWHIKDSEFSPITINGVLQCFGNLCDGGIEPDNKTWEIGVNLGAKF